MGKLLFEAKFDRLVKGQLVNSAKYLDASGKRINWGPTKVAGASIVSDKTFGKVLRFNGKSDHIRLPKIKKIKALSIWVKMSAPLGPYSYLMDSRPGQRVSYFGAGTIGSNWKIMAVNGKLQTQISWNRIPRNKWTHLYLEAKNPFNSALFLMSRFNVAEFGNGALSQLRIYDSPLSEKEIIAQKTADLARLAKRKAAQKKPLKGQSKLLFEAKFDRLVKGQLANSAKYLDASGKQINLGPTKVAGASIVSDKTFDKVLRFNGKSDHVRLPKINKIKALSIWVKMSAPFGPYSYLIDSRPGQRVSYFGAGAIGSNWKKMAVNGKLQTQISWNRIPRNKWTHLYLEAKTPFNSALFLMSRFNVAEFGNGALSQLRIYDSPLSKEEIIAQKTADLARLNTEKVPAKKKIATKKKGKKPAKPVAKVKLRLSNDTPFQLGMYKVDENGVEVLKAVKNPGGSQTYNSTKGQTWLFRHHRTNRLIGTYLTKPQKTQNYSLQFKTTGRTVKAIEFVNDTLLSLSLEQLKKNGSVQKEGPLHPGQKLHIPKSVIGAAWIARDIYSGQIIDFVRQSADTQQLEINDKDLIATDVKKKAKVTFKNHLPFPVNLFRINEVGKEELVRSLAAWQTATEDSFQYQPWRLRSAEEQIEIASFLTKGTANEQFAIKMKSPSSGRYTEIDFRNETTQTLEVVWMDAEGKEHLMKRLKSSETFFGQTEVGHFWWVRNEAAKGERRINIDGEKVRRKPQVLALTKGLANQQEFVITGETEGIAITSKALKIRKQAVFTTAFKAGNSKCLMRGPWCSFLTGEGSKMTMVEQEAKKLGRVLPGCLLSDPDAIATSRNHPMIIFQGNQVQRYSLAEKRAVAGWETPRSIADYMPGYYKAYPKVDAAFSFNTNASDHVYLICDDTIVHWDFSAKKQMGKWTLKAFGLPFTTIDGANAAGDNILLFSGSQYCVFNNSTKKVDLKDSIYSIFQANNYSLPKVRLASGEVELFSEQNYKGESLIVRGNVSSAAKLKGLKGGSIASFRPGPNTGLTAFSEDKFKGTDDVFTLATSNFESTDIGESVMVAKKPTGTPKSYKVFESISQGQSDISYTTVLGQEYQMKKGKMVEYKSYRTSLTFPAGTKSVKIYANEEVELIIGTERKTVDAIRCWENLQPNVQNQLLVNIEAKDMGVPGLQIVTEYMDADQRFMVYPEEDVHQKIANLKEDELFKNAGSLGIDTKKVKKGDCRGITSALKQLANSAIAMSGGATVHLSDEPEYEAWGLDFGALGTRKSTFYSVTPKDAEKAFLNAVPIDGDVGQWGIGKAFKKAKRGATKVTVRTTRKARKQAEAAERAARRKAEAAAAAARKQAAAAAAAAKKQAAAAAAAAKKKAAQAAAEAAKVAAAAKKKAAAAAATKKAAEAAAAAAKKKAEEAAAAAKKAAEAAAAEAKAAAEKVAEEAKNAAESVKDFAEDVGEGFVDFAEKTLEVVVMVAGEAFSFIVDAVEKVGAFVSFLVEQIGVLIEKFIDFLMSLFGWKDILETHRIIHDLIENGFEQFDNNFSSLKSRAASSLQRGQQHLLANPKLLDNIAGNKKIAAFDTPNLKIPGLKEFNWLFNKVLDNLPDLGDLDIFKFKLPIIEKLLGKFKKAIDALSLTALPQKKRDEFNKNIALILQQPGKALVHLFNGLKGIFNTMLQHSFAVMESILGLLLDFAKIIMDVLGSVLTKVFKIPFVSDLYKFLTGRKLSLLSLLSLLAAIPITIVMRLKGVFSSLGGALSQESEVKVKEARPGYERRVLNFVYAFSHLALAGTTAAESYWDNIMDSAKNANNIALAKKAGYWANIYSFLNVLAGAGAQLGASPYSEAMKFKSSGEAIIYDGNDEMVADCSKAIYWTMGCGLIIDTIGNFHKIGLRKTLGDMGYYAKLFYGGTSAAMGAFLLSTGAGLLVYDLERVKSARKIYEPLKSFSDTWDGDLPILESFCSENDLKCDTDKLAKYNSDELVSSLKENELSHYKAVKNTKTETPWLKFFANTFSSIPGFLAALELDLDINVGISSGKITAGVSLSNVAEAGIWFYRIGSETEYL